MDKVSIIIPVYNTEAYIEKCIRSLMMQTYQDIEVIVVDDGSTDGSRLILERLSREDSRICLIQQENGGVASARNKGLEFASGTYLTFVDGDDYVSDDYIETLVQCAKCYSAEMVICGLQYVDESGKVLRRLVPDGYVRFEHEEWAFRISAVCSHLYDRKLWEKHNIMFHPGERGEDMPISLFFSTICAKITTLSQAGYFYVQHSSSARHNFRGLRYYRLPYQALENIVQKIQKVGVANSVDFYELFVLRILATCLFDLGRGASRKDMRELCDYIVYILETYIPKYYKNQKAKLFSDVKVPFFQKMAVWLLVILARTKLLYPTAGWFLTGKGGEQIKDE